MLKFVLRFAREVLGAECPFTQTPVSAEREHSYGKGSGSQENYKMIPTGNPEKVPSSQELFTIVYTSYGDWMRTASSSSTSLSKTEVSPPRSNSSADGAGNGPENSGEER